MFGQGDATVIISPGGDAGLVNGGRNAGWVLEAFDRLAVDTIGLMTPSRTS